MMLFLAGTSRHTGSLRREMAARCLVDGSTRPGLESPL